VARLAGGEGGCGGAAMADEAEVAGEVRERATGRGFPIRKLLEKEEDEGKSLPASARSGSARPARSMAGGHEALPRAWPGRLKAPIRSGIGWG